MNRIAIVLFASILVGCSGMPELESEKIGSQTKVEKGGSGKNAKRDKAQNYFVALSKVQSAEEEKKLLSEFGQWLSKGGFKIRVEETNGIYNLSCPYFPPVTPWIEHKFYDIQNLKLIPQLENDDNN